MTLPLDPLSHTAGETSPGTTEPGITVAPATSAGHTSPEAGSGL